MEIPDRISRGAAARLATHSSWILHPGGHRTIQSVWTLGASKLKTFFRLIVPLSTAGLVTGVVLSFAHTLGEFGVVLMVGGNIEGETRTVSIDIYDEVQALNYVGAAKTAFFLL